MLFTEIDLFNSDSSKKGSSGVDSAPVPSRANSELADELLTMFDRWHAHREVWDDALDAQIHRMNLEILTTNKPRLSWGQKGQKYLTPSSANSDKRELFLKLNGAQRDVQQDLPFRGRWRRMGTAFGDVLQRDMLFIEKHWEKEFGGKPPFVPEYVDVNGRLYPSWERFAQRIVWIEHRGHKIPILGQPDGILRHVATGKRVGWEIKSKQTSSATTGFYSMKDAKIDHVKQSTLYTCMYGDMCVEGQAPLDDYIVLYGNLSKKSWNMDEEEYAKNPDMRAFHFQFTDEGRITQLDYLADVLDAVESGFPPPLDIEKWTFNNYKTAAALSLLESEVVELRNYVGRIRKSRLSDKQKLPYIEALQFIEDVRKGAGL